MKASQRGDVPSPKVQDGQQVVPGAEMTSIPPATPADTEQRGGDSFMYENWCLHMDITEWPTPKSN